MLFPIEDYEQWTCQVRIYLVSHSQLQIRMENSETQQVKFINFTGVEFYDGPLEWRGAGFFIGENSECLSILRKMDAYTKDSDDILLSEMSLFIVRQHDGHSVRIVAGKHPSLTEENLFASYIP